MYLNGGHLEFVIHKLYSCVKNQAEEKSGALLTKVEAMDPH